MKPASSSPLAFLNLFDEFRAPSWAGWRVVLARLTPNVREFFAIVGRGAGKSRIVALLACCFASRPYALAPGEKIYVGVFAPDRKQAGITFRYIVGLMRSVPTLAALIQASTKESLTLTNGIVVEVLSATIAAPRGRAYALVIVEEAAFLPTDTGSNPDTELLRAVRPALARVPGSLLAVVSSPYARRGVLWHAWQKYHGQPDSDVVLVQAATLELNPTFDQAAVAKAIEDDPAAAGAEYLAQFRTDVESLLPPAAIEAVTMTGRHQLPPVSVVQQYHAFVDPAGGSGSDSFTAAVAHIDAAGHGVLDLVFERRPPFSPEQTVADIAAALKPYGLVGGLIVGDHYAGEWPREAFAKHDLSYWPSAKTKSDLYRELVPLVNSEQVELLDVPRLVAQLAGLERRVARGGRDTIDHGPGGHDDVANVAAGALVEAWTLGAAVTGAGSEHAITDEDTRERLAARRRLEAREAGRANEGAHYSQGLGCWVRTMRAVRDEDNEDGRCLMDGNPYES